MDSHFQDVDYGFADEDFMEDKINTCGTTEYFLKWSHIFKLNNFYVIEGK